MGVSKVSWLFIRFIVVMVPIVFLLNGLNKHDWLEAFLFGLAVAVGLTPEMLPMIVTTNLAKGAVTMAKHKTIVKRLNAIQNFGAMDVLCTDKTGTLTQDKIVLERHINVVGEEDDAVLALAYLNSFYQTGLKNLLDVAVLEHGEIKAELAIDKSYSKVDEIPFDFTRRRMSVVVEHEHQTQRLICKGAVEEMLRICRSAHDEDRVTELNDERREDAKELVDGDERGRVPRGGRGVPRLRAAHGSVHRGRRERSRAGGVHRLPRSAQGERRAGDQGARAARREREDPHRRQRPRLAQGLPGCGPRSRTHRARQRDRRDSTTKQLGDVASTKARCSRS